MTRGRSPRELASEKPLAQRVGCALEDLQSAIKPLALTLATPSMLELPGSFCQDTRAVDRAKDLTGRRRHNAPYRAEQTAHEALRTTVVPLATVSLGVFWDSGGQIALKENTQ